MPKSRLEVSFYGFQQQIDAAWKIHGNSLASTGKMGTVSFAGFDFITQNTQRAGFLTDGSHYLQTHGPSGYPESKLLENTIIGESLNLTPVTLFTFTLADNTVYSFEAQVQARRSSGLDRAAFIRSVLAYRESSPCLLEMQHSLLTINKTGYSLEWQASGNNISLVATGLSGHQVYWSGYVKRQGIQQP